MRFVWLWKKLLVTTLIETPEFISGNYEIYWTFPIHQKIQITLVSLRKLWNLLDVPNSSKNTNHFGFTPLFCFRRIVSEKLIFEIRLRLKEPLVVTFGETRACNSRKCVVVQGMNLTKSSKKHKLVWLHSSIFTLE